MKKKLLSLFLVLCAILGLMATTKASSITWTSEDDSYTLYFDQLSDGTLEVTSCLGEAVDGLVIPDTVNGMAVTSIGAQAFSSDDHVGPLVIPDTVTYIGKRAFYYCSGLTGDLILPEGLTELGNEAFYNCKSLNGELVFPSTMKTIGYSAFYGCTGLTGGLSLPSGLTSIGKMTFYNCSGLNGSLTIPQSVTSIGDSAFNRCSGLTGSVVIPDSVTTIGGSAFYNCSGFTGDLILGSGLTSIGSSAFYNCSGFTGDVVIPDSVTSLGSSAFTKCSGGDLTLGTGVTVIPANMFKDSGFTGTLTIPEGVTEIGEKAFYGSSSLTGDLILPNSLTTLGTYAFYNCGFGGELSLGSLTVIPDHAFYNCSFSNSLILPELITTVDACAFQNCSFGGDLYISDSVTSIGNYAFSDSTFTGDLYVGKSLTEVGTNAFRFCKGFTGDLTIQVYNEASNYIAGWTSGFAGDLTIYSGAISDSAFALESGFKGTLTLGDGVTSIGANAFKSCSGFTGDLIIPDSVTSIGSYAFSGCTGLTGSLTLSESISAIGDYAFNNCTGLTGNLVIPDSVTSIGSNAFYDCSSFNGELILGADVVTIGSYAFYNCSGLTGDLIVPSGTTDISDYAFYQCAGLTGELQLPECLLTVGASAFENCAFTSDIYIPDSVTSLGAGVFKGCSGNNIYVGSGITEIPKNAFYRGTFTGTLTLSEGLLAIGTTAFYYCSDLTGDLVIPQTVTSIEDMAFSGTGFTGDLTIPDQVKTIGSSAFSSSGFTGDLIIGDGVSSIGQYAFSGTGFAGDLVVGSSVTSVGEKALRDVGFLGDLTVKYANEATAALLDGIKTFTGNLTVLAGDIPNSMFQDYSSFTGNLTLGEDVTSIGDQAFNSCTGLTGSLMIPDSVTSIGKSAFYGCTGLDGTIRLSNNVISIGSGAFSRCSNLTGALVVPASVQKIESNAFYMCTSLTRLELNEGLTSIGDYAFGCCTGITGDLIIPDSVTYIGIFAFEQLQSTGNVDLGNGVEFIGAYAFWNADYTGQLVFPDSLTYIGNSAFEGCSGFVGDLIIPDAVTSIGAEAFYGCTGLNGEIIIGSHVAAIGEYAFADCDFTGSISIPAACTSVGQYAFQNCEKLTTLYFTEATTLASNVFYNVTIETVHFFGTEEQASYIRNDRALNYAKWNYYGSKYPTSIYLIGSDLVGVGTRIALTPVITPSDATNKAITWSSSDASVATVSNGLVTGVSEGVATITATTINGLTAQRKVEVRKNIITITVYGANKDDPYSRAPLQGARVNLLGVVQTTDASGVVSFDTTLYNSYSAPVSISCDGYFSVSDSVFFSPSVDNSFTLQHKGDDIYITQLDAKIDGTDYDLLGSSRVAAIPLMDGSERNQTLYSITVGVDWNYYPEGTIALWGLSSGSSVILERGTNMVALAKYFDALETICIVATTKDENNNIVRLQEDLPLKIYLEADLTPPAPDAANLDDLYITEDFLAGLAFGNFAAGAHSVKYKNGILTIEWGMEDKDSVNVDLFSSDLFTSSADGSVGLKVSGSVDFPVLDPYGEWAGTVRAATEVKSGNITTFKRFPIFTFKKIFYVKGLPLNIKLKAEAGVSAALGLRGTFDAPIFSGIAQAEGLIAAGGGLGGEFVDGVEVSANLMGNIEPSASLTYSYPLADLSAPTQISFNPKLEGYLSGVATLGLDFLDLDVEAGIKLGGFTWDPENGILWYNVIEGNTPSVQLLGTDSEWKPIGWDYLANGGGFSGGEVSLYSTRQSASTLFYENIHMAGEAVLTILNGTPVIVFTNGDPDTQDAYNNLRLGWSQLTDSGWTEPQWVSNDSSADLDPAASGSFVAWVDSNGTMTADDTIADKFAMREITVGVWNGSGYTTTRLTDNSDFDHAVKIADLGDGTALCAWLVNDPAVYAQDLTGKTDTTDIAWAWYNGTDWNTRGVLENVGVVTNLNVTENGVITYKDSSGQLYTAELSGGTVQQPQTSHSAVGRYAVADDLTAWFDENGNLSIYENGSLSATLETDFVGSENPVAVTSDSGSYIFWIEHCSIWYTTNVSGSWSEKLRLVEGDGVFQGLSAVLDSSGGCKVSYVNRMDDVSNLQIVDIPSGHDLELQSIGYDESLYAEDGQVHFAATVFNNSGLPITDGTVDFYENGVLICSVEIPQTIAPGETVEFDSIFAPSDGSAIHEYTVSANASDDYNTQQGILSLTVGSTDTSVYDAEIISDASGEQYLHVMLHGTGSSDMSDASIVVRSGNESGEILATQAVDTICSGDMQEIVIPLDAEIGTVYHISLLSESDQDPTNNVRLATRPDDVPVLNAELLNDQITVEVNTRKLDCSNAMAVLAIMSSEGKMQEAVICDLTTLSADKGILSFQETASSVPADGYVRVMVLDKQEYIPLCNAVTVTN